MNVFKGKKGNLKATSILALCCIVLISLLFFFTERGFFPWFFIALLFLILFTTYAGIVISISIDKNKIVIKRPLSIETIKIPDISFCALHDIGEGQSTLYLFVRKRYGKDYKIKGVKSDRSYEEIIQALSTERRPDGVNINFNKASKVPLALVEDGNKLKEIILENINIKPYNASYC